MEWGLPVSFTLTAHSPLSRISAHFRFLWEGLGWSWIGEANRIVYERALVVFLALFHDSQC